MPFSSVLSLAVTTFGVLTMRMNPSLKDGMATTFTDRNPGSLSSRRNYSLCLTTIRAVMPPVGINTRLFRSRRFSAVNCGSRILSSIRTAGQNFGKTRI